MSMQRIHLDLTPGRLWQSRVGSNLWPAAGSVWSVLGTARDICTGRDMVVCRREDGPDAVQLLTCSLALFAGRFFPKPPDPPPQPPAPEPAAVPSSPDDPNARLREIGRQQAAAHGEACLLLPAGVRSSIHGVPSVTACVVLESMAASEERVAMGRERIEPAGEVRLASRGLR